MLVHKGCDGGSSGRHLTPRGPVPDLRLLWEDHWPPGDGLEAPEANSREALVQAQLQELSGVVYRVAALWHVLLRFAGQ